MYRLLGTAGCHLCELAKEMLMDVAKSRPIEVLEIDIAEDTHWQDAYAIRIPVLLHPESGQDLGWPFTQEQLLNFINELNHDA